MIFAVRLHAPLACGDVGDAERAERLDANAEIGGGILWRQERAFDVRPRLALALRLCLRRGEAEQLPGQHIPLAVCLGVDRGEVRAVRFQVQPHDARSQALGHAAFLPWAMGIPAPRLSRLGGRFDTVWCGTKRGPWGPSRTVRRAALAMLTTILALPVSGSTMVTGPVMPRASSARARSHSRSPEVGDDQLAPKGHAVVTEERYASLEHRRM